MPTRRPPGGHDEAKKPASSTISEGEARRIAPAFRHAASTASIAEVSEPVCERASRCPAFDAPVVRIIVGFPAARRRASPPRGPCLR